MLLPELSGYLEAQGIGTRQVDIFYSRLPDQPDSVVALFEYAGRGPDIDHDGGLLQIEHPAFQVQVRDPDYDTGRLRIHNVYRAFVRVGNDVIGGTEYHNVLPLQSPFFLRRDDSDRAVFVCNFLVSKGLSPS